MKKFEISLMVIVVLLMTTSVVSAEVFTFDNKVDYVDETLLKVDIINRLDLIGENKLGTIELKSHKEVTEIIELHPRAEVYQASMYYD